MICPICGQREVGIHRCSKRALERREAMFRREEESDEIDEPDEPTYDERLEVGFEILSLMSRI